MVTLMLASVFDHFEIVLYLVISRKVNGIAEV
jgi:hypothetical protein